MLINYDKSYFEGKQVDNPCPAGYDNYKKTAYHTESAYQRATVLRAKLGYGANNILILGCAYGFLVEELVKSGRNAYGLDISEYAISQAPDSISNRLVLGNAAKLEGYTAALALANISKFDAIVDENMLCCLTDDEVKNLCRITEGSQRLHIVQETPKLATWYNYRSMIDWRMFLQDHTGLWFSSIDWRQG